MKIVVDRNIRGAEDTFGRHGELVFLDGREIGAEHLRDARALIIRTATRVDETLLKGSSVGFVGSTSIGTDHLDISGLERLGIAWANAPGCNADSAAQYTLAMIWLACARLGLDLRGLTVGIIGRGNVGSRVFGMLAALGVDVVANDPPLEALGVSGLVPQAEALNRDVVCLHVPLTRSGSWPTFRFIGQRQLARMPDHALLVNTARGDVVDGEALKEELGSSRLRAALDVWPGEPRIDPDLLAACTVATPHVAGYSDDGKQNGTRMVYRAFCEWAGLAFLPYSPASSPPPEWVLTNGREAVSQALEAACFVQRHDTEMRALSKLGQEQRSAGFDRLRRDYPSRRDFQNWTVRLADVEQADVLRALGFRVTLNHARPVP